MKPRLWLKLHSDPAKVSKSRNYCIKLICRYKDLLQVTANQNQKRKRHRRRQTRNRDDEKLLLTSNVFSICCINNREWNHKRFLSSTILLNDFVYENITVSIYCRSTKTLRRFVKKRKMSYGM
jgi:hypothetical protein